MILIAHRGNIDGPNPERENNPLYFLNTIKSGFDIEIDIWKQGTDWLTGHDEPKYILDSQFIHMAAMFGNVWFHAKNLAALHILMAGENKYNVFWHEKDDYTLTSGGHIWCYPDKCFELPKGSKRLICVMPERQDDRFKIPENAYAICTDFPRDYEDKSF